MKSDNLYESHGKNRRSEPQNKSKSTEKGAVKLERNLVAFMNHAMLVQFRFGKMF